MRTSSASGASCGHDDAGGDGHGAWGWGDGRHGAGLTWHWGSLPEEGPSPPPSAAEASCRGLGSFIFFI